MQKFSGCQNCGARLRLKSRLAETELVLIQVGVPVLAISVFLFLGGAGLVVGLSFFTAFLVVWQLWSKSIMNFFFEVEEL